ncbi:MAG: hypothetical protein NVS9B10_09190 [Nevskia sp.]
MNSHELDLLDSAIARIEGLPGSACDSEAGRYRPTRSSDETLRLMDKYIAKVVRMNDGDWAAIGPSGRACVGPTLPVAVCRAILEAR